MPRRKQPAENHGISTALKEENHPLRTSVELAPPDREIIEPRHTARVRPTGPRKREVGEAGSIYTGPNVLVKMDADTVSFDVKRPLTNESRDGVEMHLTMAQQDKLVALGGDDVSPNGDASAWMFPRSAKVLAKIQEVAVELDGKNARLGNSQAR